MEYAANGDLKSFLKRGRLDWATKVSIARQIADGMNYLHSQNPSIVHRDLKCQNILVTGDGRVKVSDFGLSRSMTNGAESSRLGTLNWLAPEVLRGGTFSSAADVYAMGMCMYEILMDGEPPYNDWLPLQIVRAIDEGEHPQMYAHICPPLSV
jgi:serine/threonine protein kinase